MIVMNQKKIKQRIIEILKKKEIKDATNDFAKRVTIDNGMGKEERAKWIDEIFSSDATLRPTVGQVIRNKNSNPNIEAYFRDYFSRSVIPNLSVLKADFNIVKLNKDLYANYAYVKFLTSSDDSSLTAVMSFIWKKNPKTKKWEILLLHSQPIYLEVPPPLIKQGDVFSKWELPKPYGNF
jgi:ribosome-binding factor A